MGLIETEQDTAEVLRAEDLAITEATKPEEPERHDDIAALIERLTSESAPDPVA